MPIGEDFTLDYVNKRVYHFGGTTVYTVNELYSYLQDTFDDLDQMDDPIPMSAQTPTDYTLINGWFMDDPSFKYLKGGAIKTVGHNNEIQILTLQASGYTNCVSGDIGKTVTDDTANTGPLLAYDNTTRKWWIRWGTQIASGSTMAITGGTGAGTAAANSATGENLWPNVYTLGTIQSDNSETIYIIQNAVKLTGWWPALHIDVLAKTKEAGTEIDNGIITVFLRHYPDTLPARGNADLYDHFEIDLTAGGRNAVPLATSPDLNNTTDDDIVAGYSDITIAFVNGTVTHGAVTGTFQNFEAVTWTGGSGIMLKDTGSGGTMTIGNVDGDNGPLNTEVITGSTSGATTTASANMTIVKTMTKAFEQATDKNYSIIANCATRILMQIYERFKWTTRGGNSTFDAFPTKMQSATLSIVKTDGEQYVTAHTDLDTPTNTFSPVKASPFATFAGGKLFGARGLWVENMNEADIQNFQLIDSDNVTQTPPNKQPISVTNLKQYDRVSVFRTVSTSNFAIKKNLYTSHASNNTSGAGTFEVQEALFTDTPSSGTLRVVDTTDSSEIRYAYTSFSGKVFTLSGTLQKNYDGTDTCYIPYVDKEVGAAENSASATVIYSADRGLLIRIRRKTNAGGNPPILPFEATGTYGSTGFSIATIRTEDTIVA